MFSRDRLILAGWASAMTFVAMPTYALRPGINLTTSWQSALHLAVANGVNFGTEAAFTYGPLGFVAFPQLYSPTTTLLATIALVLTTWLTALVTLGLIRRHTDWLPALVSTYLIMTLGWNRLLQIEWLPESAAALVAVASLYLVTRHVDGRESLFSRVRLGAGFGAISALFFLTKLSSGVQVSTVTLATLLILFSSGTAGFRGATRPVVAWFGSFVAVFLIVWVMLGQSVGAIPAHLDASAQLVSGYSGAMGLERDNAWQYPAALYLVGILGAIVVQRWGYQQIRRQPIVLAPLVLFIFAAFKHGFVRHDIHALVFFVTVPLLSLAFLRRGNATIVAAVLGLGLVAAWGAVGVSFADAIGPRDNIVRSAEVARLVVDGSYRISEIDAARDTARSSVGLSDETIGLLRGERVHVDPWEIGLLWAYQEFEWGSPPVFQTFAAYTADLDDLNADWLRSEVDAPTFVLRTPVSIDRRHPSLESPEYMIELACRYDKVDEDGVWFILERHESRCGAVEDVAENTVEVGERFDLPVGSACAGLFVFSVEGLESAGQRLQSLIYKDATWSVRFSDDQSYRLPPGTASQTHLVPTADLPAWVGPGVSFDGVEIDKSGSAWLSPDTVTIKIGCMAVVRS